MKGHNGNAASLDAWDGSKARHANGRADILSLIDVAGERGITSKELADKTGWSLNTFSGRISELKFMGKVRGTGERRRGAEVLVVVRVAEQLSFLEGA